MSNLSLISQVALDKLYRFATSRVFESEVAGKMCADMCCSAAKVRPVVTLRRFVPACTAAIERILEGEWAGLEGRGNECDGVLQTQNS